MLNMKNNNAHIQWTQKLWNKTAIFITDAMQNEKLQVTTQVWKFKGRSESGEPPDPIKRKKESKSSLQSHGFPTLKLAYNRRSLQPFNCLNIAALIVSRVDSSLYELEEILFSREEMTARRVWGAANFVWCQHQ